MAEGMALTGGPTSCRRSSRIGEVGESGHEDGKCRLTLGIEKRTVFSFSIPSLTDFSLTVVDVS